MRCDECGRSMIKMECCALSAYGNEPAKPGDIVARFCCERCFKKLVAGANMDVFLASKKIAREFLRHMESDTQVMEMHKTGQLETQLKITVPFSPGAKRLLEIAAQTQKKFKSPHLCLNHWLYVLFERFPGMARALVKNIQPARLGMDMKNKLKSGDLGAPMPVKGVVEKSCAITKEQRRPVINERAFAHVLLEAAGFDVEVPAFVQAGKVAAELKALETKMLQREAPEAAVPAAPSPSATGLIETPLPQEPTPLLDQAGRDLTAEAREETFSSLDGRDEGAVQAIKALGATPWRYPVLFGPADVYPNWAVEGVTRRLIVGDVPEILRNRRLISVYLAELSEGQAKGLLEEAEKARVLLFVEDLFSLLRSEAGFAFRAAIGRGRIACLGAGSDDDYRQVVERDPSLAKRFAYARVREMTDGQTMNVLRRWSEQLKARYQVVVPETMINWLVELSRNLLPGRYFPGRAVELLERTVVRVTGEGRQELTAADAEETARELASRNP